MCPLQLEQGTRTVYDGFYRDLQVIGITGEQVPDRIRVTVMNPLYCFM